MMKYKLEFKLELVSDEEPYAGYPLKEQVLYEFMKFCGDKKKNRVPSFAHETSDLFLDGWISKEDMMLGQKIY